MLYTAVNLYRARFLGALSRDYFGGYFQGALSKDIVKNLRGFREEKSSNCEKKIDFLCENLVLS